MRPSIRPIAPGLVALLLLANAVGVFAQEQGSEAAPPVEVAPPADAGNPPQGSPPTTEQQQAPTELLDTVSRDLENVLGPLPNLRCSVTAIGSFPIMQCESGDSDD